MPPRVSDTALSPESRKVEALLAMGRTEEAAALADRLPEREQPSPEFLRLRGRAHRAAGRNFDAETSFRQALALAPGDAGLMADLATTLHGQRRYKDARTYAREAVGLRPDVAAYHALLGVIAEALHFDDEAGEELGMARQLAPQDVDVHTAYGFHALRLGRHAEAEMAFRAAVAIDPRRPEAFRGLARISLARGDLAEARTRWIEALGADPSLHDAQLERTMWLGHPMLAPVRVAKGVPVWASAGLAVIGGLLIRPVPAVAVVLFLVASVGPFARIWWRRQ